MKNKIFYLIPIVIIAALVLLCFDNKQNQNHILMPIKVNDKYGYKNQHNKIVIKPKYKQAFDFCNGKALVQYCNNENECHVDLINKKGKRINKQKIISNLEFFNNLSVAGINNKYGYINKCGDFIIEPKYEVAFAFSNNLAPVAVYDVSRRCNLWGYINTNGEIVIPFQFFEANNFIDDIAIIKTMFGYNIINKGGKMLCRQVFFSDMPPIIKDKKILTYDTHSNWPLDTYTEVIELDCHCKIINRYDYNSD